MSPERLLAWAARVEQAANTPRTPRLDMARAWAAELRAPKEKQP